MEAEDQYNLGVEQKSKGQIDAALTSFRRAVLADPKHFPAHMGIGYLCRDKAKMDPMFQRYAYDAFKKAVRLDPTSEDAHNQYIMLGQKMGVIDELLNEYGGLAKQAPDNAMYQKLHKNLVAVSMAMIPQNVNLATASSSGLRKMLLFMGIGGFLLGLALIVSAPVLVKKNKIPKEKMGGLVKVGLAISGIGVASFVGRAKV